MSNHNDESANLITHIQRMYAFRDLVKPLTDLSDRGFEQRPKTLTLTLTQNNDASKSAELDPNAMDTYIIFKQIEEFLNTRIEQLETTLATVDSVNQLFKN
jgi:hypothetical protein